MLLPREKGRRQGVKKCVDKNDNISARERTTRICIDTEIQKKEKNAKRMRNTEEGKEWKTMRNAYMFACLYPCFRVSLSVFMCVCICVCVFAYIYVFCV